MTTTKKMKNKINFSIINLPKIKDDIIIYEPINFQFIKNVKLPDLTFVDNAIKLGLIKMKIKRKSKDAKRICDAMAAKNLSDFTGDTAHKFNCKFFYKRKKDIEQHVYCNCEFVKVSFCEKYIKLAIRPQYVIYNFDKEKIGGRIIYPSPEIFGPEAKKHYFRFLENKYESKVVGENIF